MKAHSCAGDLGAVQAGHRGVSCRPISWCSRIGFEGRSKGFLSRRSDRRAPAPQLTIEASGGAERPVCPLHRREKLLDVDVGTISHFDLFLVVGDGRVAGHNMWTNYIYYVFAGVKKKKP